MSSRQLVLLGGGGHGRVVLDALFSRDIRVGYVLDAALTVGECVFGVPVMGDDNYLNGVNPADTVLVNGVGANPSLLRREQLFDEMSQRGFSFLTVQHSSSVVGSECYIGEASQIMAGAVMQNRVQIGMNAVINTRASLDHDCVICANAFVSPGAVLTGGVRVGESAFVGAGAIILPGREVGARAIVGAGSVVIHSVPEGWIVAGNPATKIGTSE